MQLPPLQPITNIEPFVSGDVKIDPSVAIAPGVIIQAADNCQVIIGEGVCIGMGVIIHAYQGNIEIESGATIGSGVLLVGKSKIGANACVGALATIMEQDLESKKVVLPAFILGDSGRKIADNSTTSFPHQKSAKSYISSDENQESNSSLNVANNFSYSEESQVETEEVNTKLKSENTVSNSEESQAETEEVNTKLKSENTVSTLEKTKTETEKNNTKLKSGNTGSISEKTQAETEKNNTKLKSGNTVSTAEETKIETEKNNTQLQSEPSPNIDPRIYGKEYVNQIMKTLFPYKNSLSSHPDDED
ncbi:hypothetical protein [Okeania sp.]|uniref:acyltransferase n=1 Tax=Okeania sp. TaxID=3100323 RepID=UPI002B4B1F32|nr:hypothetical protein [Okeania sp.]MEB3340010.1 hypothetical protein [Okeania sp.]